MRSCTNLGMKQLAIMPVDTYGFTLYFYAATDEQPPSTDPYAIENRTWIYQRPYTVLEFQHIAALENIHRPAANAAGYDRTLLSGPDTTVTAIPWWTH